MNATRICFITSFHPGGSGEIGAGEAICEDSVRMLHAAGKEIHLLCLAPPTQSANPRVVSLCASYQTLNHSLLQAALGILHGMRRGSLLAPWFFSRVSPRNIHLLRNLLRNKRIDEVWIDFPSSLGFAACLEGVTIEYFVHDVVTQKIGRNRLLSCVCPSVQKVEERLLSLLTRCVTLSQKDADLLRRMNFAGAIDVAPPSNIRVGTVSNGMPIATLLERFVGCKNIVFFGNMKRPENHWSLLHFLLFAYPRIHKMHPDAQFWILGLSPRWLLRCAGWLLPGVHVVGAVDDPMPAFRAASICVAPLRLGAGVKIKVLQMLEAGATVIASPVGGEGISASANLFVVPYDEIAGEVCRRLLPLPRA